MPGFHVHSLYAPAVSIGDLLLPGLCIEGAQPVDGRNDIAPTVYEPAGTLMLMSTKTHRLQDYVIYHRLGVYSMGPFSEDWQYLATVGEYYQ